MTSSEPAAAERSAAAVFFGSAYRPPMRRILALLAAAGPAASCATPRPPVAAERPHEIRSAFGTRVDEYYWMRDDDPERKRPEIMAHLEAEQAYTEAAMKPVAALEKTVFDEIRARIKEDDDSVPVHHHGWWYWTSFEKGDEYPKVLRRRGGTREPDLAQPAETVLDQAELAKGRDYFALGSFAVSDCGRFVAWTEDRSGRRIHTLRVKDLVENRILPDEIGGVLEPVVWAGDGSTLFYVKQDPVLLVTGPVWRHEVGQPPANDALVYEEPDDELSIDIRASASEEFIVIDSDGFDTNEVRVVPRARPTAAPEIVVAREDGVRSYADHIGGRWYLRTNREARNFRLMAADAASVRNRASWREVVPHRAEAAIDDFELFDGGIALAERVEANASVRVIRHDGSAAFSIPADATAFTMLLSEGSDAAVPFVRVVYSTMTTPATTIDVDLATGARTVRKVQPVPGFDPSLYDSTRVWAPSRDGKRIPVSIAWRKDAYRRDGTAPLLIDGYGSYGISADADFGTSWIPLLDRGFAIAYAHIRGGADLGQDWYEDGRLLRKRNTFNDFVDATDHLVAEKWGAPGLVFAKGGSAGGLLMGVVANEAGDRYRGIVLGVPFVDALTTMLDPTIPLTANEWTQWGNPIESREAYEYIRSYSPYDNLAAKPYPAMLVVTGLWDSQVQYFEPAKYVARLRRLRTDANPFLFQVNMEAGHGGKSGRFERLKGIAREHAFVLDLAGVER
jgi:oligopeptidase B